MRRAALLLAIAACGSAAKAPAPLSNTSAPVAVHPPIVWTIDCAPSTVAMADRANVMVTIHATNTTAAARDPERDPLDVLVDGTSSMELEMAFNNGGREATWNPIPPGVTVTDQRTGMDLVATPGDHVIAIGHAGRELARTTLHVTR